MRTEKDIALERVETGKEIGYDVSILSIKQRLTHKLLTYTKDRMEKLIELLNEYQGQDSWSYDEKQGTPYIGWGDDLDYECYIISKKYGFIKWLVENEKIDFESENYPLKKCYPYYDDVLAIVSQNINTYEDYCKSCYDKYESLLMLLSIQDNPIEFLVSILK